MRRATPYPRALNEAVDEHRSLYDGAKGDGLADVAPYLVHFRSDSGLLGRIVEEGWGRAFGIFAVSSRPFVAVRRHFRRLLIVEEAETTTRMYFRFYDPRALRGSCRWQPCGRARSRGGTGRLAL